MNATERQATLARRTFDLLSEDMRRTVQDVARARGCEPLEVLAAHFGGKDILPKQTNADRRGRIATPSRVGRHD